MFFERTLDTLMMRKKKKKPNTIENAWADFS